MPLTHHTHKGICTTKYMAHCFKLALVADHTRLQQDGEVYLKRDKTVRGVVQEEEEAVFQEATKKAASEGASGEEEADEYEDPVEESGASSTAGGHDGEL